MDERSFALFMIALSIPVTVFGLRMMQWYREFYADATTRAVDGRAQLGDQSLQEWSAQLRLSTFALFRYRRLLHAEITGDPSRGLVDSRPFAARSRNPEAYSAWVLGSIIFTSFMLSGIVLKVSNSPALAGVFLLVQLSTGLASARPLLSTRGVRTGAARARGMRTRG